MNFFLLNKIVDEIKSGKPIMYYNMETTGEEMKQRVLNKLENHNGTKGVITRIIPDSKH